MRRVTTVLFVALAVAALAAQQPVLKSGIEPGNSDPAVRAQDDFYRHINGKWLARTEIPADKPLYGAFTQLADQAEADVRTIIETAAADRTRQPGSVAQMVGDMYASFMNEARVEQRGAAPAQAMLAKIDAVTNLDGVAAMAGELSAINAGGPVNVGIDADPKNPAMPIAYMQQGGTALTDRDYYLVDDPKFAEIRAKNRDYLEKIFTLTNRPNAAADAKAVLDFETALARVQWTRVESRDMLKTIRASRPCRRTCRALTGWLGAAAGTRPRGGRHRRQPSFSRASAEAADADAHLAGVARRAASRRPRRTQQAVRYAGHLRQGAQRPPASRAVEAQPSNTTMGMPVGKHVEKTFRPRPRRDAEDGREPGRGPPSITGLEWMTPETKAKALEKLSKFGNKIAYPDKWRDYSGLAIRPDDLLGNVQRAQRFENDYQVGKLNKPVDRTEWEMTPQTVNAYYTPVRNEIVFPAAILQAPFFDFGADDAVNYGGIGAVIGHEIGHGFDDQGRRFDGTGALKDWWVEADEKEFQKRAKMLIEQTTPRCRCPTRTSTASSPSARTSATLGGLVSVTRPARSAGGKPSPRSTRLTGEQRSFAGRRRCGA